jgi:hypothetical protein
MSLGKTISRWLGRLPKDALTAQCDIALDLSVALINTKRRRFALRALQKSEFMYTKLWAAVFA